MGLLDGLSGIGGAAAGQGGGADAPALMAAVSRLLEQAGGLEGLLARLQAGGLGEAATSWVGTGANQPVSPDALGQALGPDLMGTLGGRLGGQGQPAGAVLAQVLPDLIDRLTPQGRVPAAGELDPMAALGSLLGGSGGAAAPDAGALLGALLRR